MTEASDGPTCDACGEPIASGDGHRVRTRVEVGRVEYRQCCDDDCRDGRDA